MRCASWRRTLILVLLVGLAGAGHSGTGQAAAGPAVKGLADRKGAAVALFVALEGNDAWSGRLAEANAAGTDGPLATPARARDLVRQLRAAGQPAGPVTIQLRGGTYFLSEPLVLKPEDSGTAAAPVMWEAYPGEKPVLSGGRRIADFVRGKDGRWTAAIPEVKEGRWRFRQLFVNGERRQRPRLPREGYFRVAKADLTGDWQKGADRFGFAPGDMRADWRNLQDVEVVVLHYWTDAHLPIATVDEATQTVTFTRKTSKRLTDDSQSTGARYFVENVLEALGPGQWYLDRRAGVLQYRPRPGEDVARLEVIAPRLASILRLEGRPEAGKFVEHVTFKGLTFSHTEWDLTPQDAGDLQAAVTVPGAVWACGARHVRIEGCEVSHGGTYGIELAEGCTGVALVGNELTDLGGGGIRLSGTPADGPEAGRTGQCTVTDNHIHDCGEVWPSAVGILSQHSGGNTFSHNHIHDLYYTGVSVGWVWGYAPSVSRDNRIEANHIHDIGRGMLSDMGGIYTLGVSPGTVIRQNLIHDVQSHGYGGWGIYTDEGSTGILIENNVVYRTKTGGFHQHYGKDNVVRNNVFAFAQVGQIQRTREEQHVSFTFDHNIIYWTEGPALHGNWKGDAGFQMDWNVWWNAAGQAVTFDGRSLEDWRKAGHDVHSVVADPQFAAPAKGDFRLKPGSPAPKLGFKPIDLGTVGVRAKR